MRLTYALTAYVTVLTICVVAMSVVGSHRPFAIAVMFCTAIAFGLYEATEMPQSGWKPRFIKPFRPFSFHVAAQTIAAVALSGLDRVFTGPYSRPDLISTAVVCVIGTTACLLFWTVYRRHDPPSRGGS